MVPSADLPFFAASMGVAATLLGLLFVAVSVAPERTVGAGAPIERQMVAESVFTALINTFFVSMAGTIPDVNFGSVALVLSAFALFQSLHMARRLWPRRVTARSLTQRLGLVVVALVIYSLQFLGALQLVRAPGHGMAVGSEIGIVFALYAFALGRTWELLGARRGILAGHLSPTFADDRQPDAVNPPRLTPPVPSEAPGVAAPESTKNK